MRNSNFWLLLAFVILCPSSPTQASPAAQPAIDSLQSLLDAQPSAPDSLQIKWYGQLFDHYTLFDAAKALSCADSIVALASRSGDASAKAVGQMSRANAFRGLTRYGEALATYNVVEGQFLALNDSLNLAKAYLNKSAVYNDLRILPEARKYKALALELSRKIGYREGEAMSLSGIGVIFLNSELYAKALEYNRQALEIFEEQGMEGRKAREYMHLASGHAGLGEYGKALGFQRKAVRHYENSHNTFQLAQVVYLMASTYRLQEKYDSCRYALHRSYALSEENGHLFGMVAALEAMTRLALEQENILRAQDMRERFNALMDRFEEPPLHLKSKLELVEARLAAMEGRFESAYKHLTDYVSYRDSAEALRKDLSVIALLEEYDAREKAQHIELLVSESDKRKLQQWFLIALIAALVLLTAWLVNRQRMRLRTKNLLLENELQAKALATERLQRAELEKRQLNDTLELKESEITELAIFLNQSQESLDKIRKMLPKGKESGVSAAVREALHAELDQIQGLDQQRQHLEVMIERKHRDYLHRLRNQFPELSSKDLRLASLLRLGLSSKEIATLLGISPGSVDTYRHRLRKKLSLEKQQSITDFLKAL